MTGSCAWCGVAGVALVTLMFCGCRAAEPERATASSTPTVPPPLSAAERDEVAVLETTEGTMVFQLLPDLAPRHVACFRQLCREGFYDGTRFFRSVPGFMIQGGCPETKTENRIRWGRGGPGFSIPAEFSDVPHERGTVSMARSEAADSAGSQFFVCASREQCRHLDGKYSVFGRVIAGTDVIDRIAALPKVAGRNEMPLEPATITRAHLLPRQQALALVGSATGDVQ